MQSAYYGVTGVAPLVSMRAFERLTGPQVDDWLVRTVGVLALGYAAVLARDACPDPLMGLAPALGFAAGAAGTAAEAASRASTCSTPPSSSRLPGLGRA